MSLVLSNAQIHALDLEQCLERTLFALRPYIAAGIPADYFEMSMHLGYGEDSLAQFVRKLISKKHIVRTARWYGNHYWGCGSTFAFAGPFVLKDYRQAYTRPKAQYHLTRRWCVRIPPSEISVPTFHRVMDRRAS